MSSTTGGTTAINTHMTFTELELWADRFTGEFHFIPNIAQLDKYIEGKRKDELSHVRVVFPGNPTRYCYRVPEGHVATIGEYMRVWSPRTARHELVRVEALGRGSWPHGTKTAIPVEVLPLVGVDPSQI